MRYLLVVLCLLSVGCAASPREVPAIQTPKQESPVVRGRYKFKNAAMQHDMDMLDYLVAKASR